MKKLMIVLAATSLTAPLAGCASHRDDGFGSRLFWWKRPAAVECPPAAYAAPACDPCAGGPAMVGGDTFAPGYIPGPMQP